MLQNDFNTYIRELSEDIEGLQRIIQRIKARNENPNNISSAHQKLDYKSMELYTTAVSRTIGELKKYVLGEKE